MEYLFQNVLHLSTKATTIGGEMHSDKRVTQSDLAQHLGISQVTVSRALARNPRVPEQVQKLVLEAAKKMGYRPDPILTRLSAYRRSRQPIERGQTLAWVSGSSSPWSLPWYVGAKWRASTLGYNLQPINPEQQRLPPRRIMSILYNQGISGLIFAPRSEPHSQLDINLDKFCAVAIGYSLREPVIDRVITDHHHNCAIIFSNLLRAGYSRIGYAYSDSNNERVEGRELSTFTHLQNTHPQLLKIPPVIYGESHEGMDAVIPPWIRQWRPDAIICSSTHIIDICQRMNLRVPEDIAIACPMRRNSNEDRSGIDQLRHETGALAVDTVVALLNGNQYGIPRQRRTIMLAGTWVDGQTTRSAPAEAEL